MKNEQIAFCTPFFGKAKMTQSNYGVIVRIDSTASIDDEMSVACAMAQDYIDEILPGHIAYDPQPITGNTYMVRVIKKEEVIFS